MVVAYLLVDVLVDFIPETIVNLPVESWTSNSSMEPFFPSLFVLRMCTRTDIHIPANGFEYNIYFLYKM